MIPSILPFNLPPPNVLSPRGALLWGTLALLAFFFVAGPSIRGRLARVMPTRTLREKVGHRLVSSILVDWGLLAIAFVFAWLRGQAPSDLGFAGTGSPYGWILSAAVLAFFAWSILFGRAQFLDRRAWFTEWSVFRITSMLAVGVTVGICEEGVFRGFVMTQARDAGYPLWSQIGLSGLAFGFFHIRFGWIGGQVNVRGLIGAFTSTTIFGWIFGCVFLLSGRQLLPCIAGHGLFGMLTEPWLLEMALGGTLQIRR